MKFVEWSVKNDDASAIDDLEKQKKAVIMPKQQLEIRARYRSRKGKVNITKKNITDRSRRIW